MIIVVKQLYSYTALNDKLSNFIDKNDSKPENKQKIHLKKIKSDSEKIDQAGGPETYF